jgi:ABC-type branched-subunit amino acid transport system permease subunit
VLALLALLPPYIGLYQTQLLIYGLIAAIAALGFNLLLGYTALLSFGHSAFFGIGAYSVAFLLRDGGIHSMELYVLIGLPIAALARAAKTTVQVGDSAQFEPSLQRINIAVQRLAGLHGLTISTFRR